jgi:hypothetical protein
VYASSIRTHGRSRRSCASSLSRRASSLSLPSSRSRAADHSSRLPVACCVMRVPPFVPYRGATTSSSTAGTAVRSSVPLTPRPLGLDEDATAAVRSAVSVTLCPSYPSALTALTEPRGRAASVIERNGQLAASSGRIPHCPAAGRLMAKHRNGSLPLLHTREGAARAGGTPRQLGTV